MRLPKINQKVSLRVLQGSWEGLYSTYVEGMDQGALTVAHPMYGGETVPLMVGEEVLIEFVDGGERLLFPSRVLGHFTQVVAILSLSLPVPGLIRRHQQRDFVRLDSNLSLRYALIPERAPEEGEVEPPVFHVGRTLDVSGSGAQIVTHEAYPNGARLQLVLEMPGGAVPLEAVVVRIAHRPSPREVWLGVRFTRVEERDRERIVRYIFSEQRFRRQKGLL